MAMMSAILDFINSLRGLQWVRFVLIGFDTSKLLHSLALDGLKVSDSGHTRDVILRSFALSQVIEVTAACLFSAHHRPDRTIYTESDISFISEDSSYAHARHRGTDAAAGDSVMGTVAARNRRPRPAPAAD